MFGGWGVKKKAGREGREDKRKDAKVRLINTLRAFFFLCVLCVPLKQPASSLPERGNFRLGGVFRRRGDAGQ